MSDYERFRKEMEAREAILDNARKSLSALADLATTGDYDDAAVIGKHTSIVRYAIDALALSLAALRSCDIAVASHGEAMIHLAGDVRLRRDS